MENGICYVNGAFVGASEAKISIFDRGFTSGEGVYEVTRTFGHIPFKLDDHLSRLYRSLKYTNIDSGISIEEMKDLTTKTFELNRHLIVEGGDCLLWHVISRGSDNFTGHPKKATVTIFVLPIAYQNFDREYIDGAVVMTPSIRRTPPQSLEARAKITNKMNLTMAMFEAKQVDPRAIPLLLDLDGNITETNMGNFFFVSVGRLCTSNDRTVLNGVTRATVISLAKENDIPVIQGNFTPYDVYCADEAFTTSTSPTITPVRSFNGISLGVPGPITLRLIRAWIEMVGVDFVSQALSYMKEPDRSRLLGAWRNLYSTNALQPSK